MNPYRQCPIYQNENYRIRFVKQSDVNDLLKVYSDPKTVALCNCDNCEDDFYYIGILCPMIGISSASGNFIEYGGFIITLSKHPISSGSTCFGILMIYNLLNIGKFNFQII